MAKFIKVEDVVFEYEKEEQGQEQVVSSRVINHISMGINEGEFIALLGHNGCGKSTMAKLFNTLLVPKSGKITVDGLDTADEENIYEIRSRVGLVLQNPDNQMVASIVEEDVAFGPENLGYPPEEIRQRVDDALKAVDMYEYRNHAPHKLSGGQKQRVAIAGIIAMEPKCIVLDEPTAMLDPRGREEVMSTITRLNKEKGITVVLITHFMDEAVLADKVIVMDKGEILLQGSPKEVFSNVELLKRHKLDVPQSTELAYKLMVNSKEQKEIPLTPEECTEFLLSVLKK